MPTAIRTASLDLCSLLLGVLDGRIEQWHRSRYLVLVVLLTSFVAHFWWVEFALNYAHALRDARMVECLTVAADCSLFLLRWRRSDGGRGLALGRHCYEVFGGN